MKTKIVLPLFLAAITLSTSLMAQTTFGLRGGVNFTNLTGKADDGEKLSNDLKVGFNAGVNAEIPVGIDFYVQPGLLYSTKGAKTDGSDNTVNIGYLELPVNFVYKPVLGTGKLILGFGPYAALGLQGKAKYENGGEKDINFKNEISQAEAISGDFFLKKMDAGANLLFGYETASKLSVQLNAGLGLMNIAPKVTGFDDDKTSLKNTTFGVSLGYRF